VNEFFGGFNGNFSWGGEGHVDFLRGKFDGIGDALCSCLVDVDTITPIVISCRSQVPTFDAMGIPRASLVGFFVNEYFGAWGC
jgi:hypothetical protein